MRYNNAQRKMDKAGADMKEWGDMIDAIKGAQHGQR
jgi:hypothetical protein